MVGVGDGLQLQHWMLYVGKREAAVSELVEDAAQAPHVRLVADLHNWLPVPGLVVLGPAQVLDRLGRHVVESPHLIVNQHVSLVGLNAAGDSKVDEFERAGYQKEVGRLKVLMDDAALVNHGDSQQHLVPVMLNRKQLSGRYVGMKPNKNTRTTCTSVKQLE